MTARLLCILLAAALLPAIASAQGAPQRPTTAEKRCAAAERRVERHREGLAALDARLVRDQSARAACTRPRACEQLDRGLKSEATRRKRIAAQLAQYENEAQGICAGMR